eukprot:3296608-Rhodomonas_salina.4
MLPLVPVAELQAIAESDVQIEATQAVPATRSPMVEESKGSFPNALPNSLRVLLTPPGGKSRVTDSVFKTPDPVGTLHITSESETHWTALHEVPPTRTWCVRSSQPMFWPVKVILIPPEVGPFESAARITTGESYEKTDVKVFALRRTVTVTPCASNSPRGVLHRSDVTDIQELDVHPLPPPTCDALWPGATASPEIRTAGLYDVAAKLSPDTVIETPPTVASLGGSIELIDGASYDKKLVSVATLARTEGPRRQHRQY